MVPHKAVKDHHENYEAHANGRDRRSLAIFIHCDDKIDMDSKQDSTANNFEEYNDNGVNIP